jgi:hypothetical protein
MVKLVRLGQKPLRQGQGDIKVYSADVIASEKFGMEEWHKYPAQMLWRHSDAV